MDDGTEELVNKQAMSRLKKRTVLANRIRGSLGRRIVRMPGGLAKRLVGKPIQLDGNRLDRDMQLVCQMTNSNPGEKIWEQAPPAARRTFAMLTGMLDDPPPAIEQSHDYVLPGPAGPIPFRVTWPKSGPKSEQTVPLPMLMFFHGGGFAIGSVDTHDTLCRRLAAEAGCIVASVEYRLAPEHPFPAAPDDCLAAFRWMTEHAGNFDADPSRIAVGGDSAGGNLSTTVCLDTRRDTIRPCFQLLIYPCTDFLDRARSHRLFAEGFMLEEKLIDWFYEQYVDDDTDLRQPRLSPLHADDLAGLPPAYLCTAGFDPLRDEGRAYADRLKTAGVAVEYVEFDDMVHGFATMSAFKRPRAALADMARALRAVFHTAHS